MGTMNMFDGCSDSTLNERLEWLHAPSEWSFGLDGLSIVPAGETDFYRPASGTGRDDASLLYTKVTGDFTAVTSAFAHLAGFGDAAALTVRASESKWAKLCLERSPVGELAVVSVVTDPWSDDANNELLSSPECRLRITRKGSTFGMHYRVDGTNWRFVRSFAMELPETVMVGIHAQAPFGEGCRVRFASFEILSSTVANFRSGE